MQFYTRTDFLYLDEEVELLWRSSGSSPELTASQWFLSNDADLSWQAQNQEIQWRCWRAGRWGHQRRSRRWSASAGLGTSRCSELSPHSVGRSVATIPKFWCLGTGIYRKPKIWAWSDRFWGWVDQIQLRQVYVSQVHSINHLLLRGLSTGKTKQKLQLFLFLFVCLYFTFSLLTLISLSADIKLIIHWSSFVSLLRYKTGTQQPKWSQPMTPLPGE